MGKSIDELIEDLIQQLPAADTAEASRIKDRINDLEQLKARRTT